MLGELDHNVGCPFSGTPSAKVLGERDGRMLQKAQIGTGEGADQERGEWEKGLRQ